MGKMINLFVSNFTSAIKVKIKKDELLIALYCALVIMSFFIFHSNAGVFNRLLKLDDFSYELNKAIIHSSMIGPIIFIVIYLLLTVNLEYNYNNPSIISLVIILILSLISLEFFLIIGIFNAWIFIYVFVLDIIVGFTIYIKYSWTLESYEKNSKNTTNTNKREFYKLWHAEILQYINTLTNTIFLIIIGGVVVAIAPQWVIFQSSSVTSPGLFLFLINHVSLIIIYLIGIWFGILAQYYNRLFKIRIEILKLN